MAKLKMPKSLGACVDMYLKLKEARLAEDKKVASMKADENEVKDHLINNIDKRDEGGAVGKTHVAVVKTDDIYVVEDWDALYAHIKKTGHFHLLGRAINQAAVKEFLGEQNRPTGKRGEGWKPKLPPGIKTSKVVKLSVTKK